MYRPCIVLAADDPISMRYLKEFLLGAGFSVHDEYTNGNDFGVVITQEKEVLAANEDDQIVCRIRIFEKNVPDMFLTIVRAALDYFKERRRIRQEEKDACCCGVCYADCSARCWLCCEDEELLPSLQDIAV